MATTAQVKKIAVKILNALESEVNFPPSSELSIVLTNDRNIQSLNKEHRGKDKPTDVLSFPQYEARDFRKGARLRGNALPSPSLGDIVISLETTERQADEYEVTQEEEFVRLLVHGVLHLCGFDHEGVPNSEAQRMRRLEKRLRLLIP